MRNFEKAFDNIIPEKIMDCQFEEMTFTKEMLDIYFMIDGTKSLAEIHRDLSIDTPDIVLNFRKLTRAGVVKMRKKNSPFLNAKIKKKYCFRGAVHYR